MRKFLCQLLLCAAGSAAAAEKVDPSFFHTLVNPPCSHCVDEGKRRGADLKESDRVMAWIRGKYDGGVPFRFFLVPYRVISDTYGVWVYDADAGYVKGYEPSLDFSFHGWRNGIMTIRNKEGTVYSALSGAALEGPGKGTSLKALPTLETDWGYWLKQYPGTVAYNMFEKYKPFDLPASQAPGSVETRLPPDPRLAPEEWVVGFSLSNQARAYRLPVLEKKKVIRDRVGGREIVLLWFAPTRSAAIYAPRF